MATHSSVLAWRIPGTGEPGGLPSMGSHRVGHDWSDLAAAVVVFSRIKSEEQGTIQWKATVFQILWQSSLQILTKTHCGPAEDKWLAQGHRVSQWHSYDLKQHCLITNWFSQPSRCAPSSVYGSKTCRVNSSRAQTESWPALHSSHHQAHALSAVNTWLIDFV